MSDGIDQSTPAAGTPGQITGWIPFTEPRDAHHAAYAAYVHSPTAAELFLFSFDGKFEWRVRYPVNGIGPGSRPHWATGGFPADGKTPEEAQAWGDQMLARIGMIPPTAA
jgi:hypothetical protein